MFYKLMTGAVIQSCSWLFGKRLYRDGLTKSYGHANILINGAGGNHPKGTTTKDYYEMGDKEGKESVVPFSLGQSILSLLKLNFIGIYQHMYQHMFLLKVCLIKKR